MDTVDNVLRIQESAEMLQKVLKSKLGDGMSEMRAVQERVEAYNAYGNKFSERVFNFLKDQFDYQAKTFMDTRAKSSRKGNSLTAVPHETIEDQLIKYQGLNLWEKEMEPRMYNELQRVNMSYTCDAQKNLHLGLVLCTGNGTFV
jgi:hypothetical protein